MNRIATFGMALALLAMSQLGFAEETSKLTSSGTGTVTAEPDEGYVSLGVSTIKPTSAEAVRTNTDSMTELYATLKELGVEKKDIRTTEFSIQRHYEQVDTGKTDRNGSPIFKTQPGGFLVQNQVRVTVCDLKNFGKVLDAVTQSGANEVGGIQFGSSKAKEKLEEARKAAVKEARAKAATLAEASDVKLARVLSIREYSSGPAPGGYARAAMRAESAADVPISGGTLNFSVQVELVWEIGTPAGG